MRRTSYSRGWQLAGVDYDDVVETLEAEAIEKFSGSLSRVVARLELYATGVKSSLDRVVRR